VRLLSDHCDLYNAALMERREAFRMRKKSIGYVAQSAQLKDIRRADQGGQGRHSFTAQQLPRAWRDRRRRERGTEYCVQGRAGLWSGSYGSL